MTDLSFNFRIMGTNLRIYRSISGYLRPSIQSEVKILPIRDFSNRDMKSRELRSPCGFHFSFLFLKICFSYDENDYYSKNNNNNKIRGVNNSLGIFFYFLGFFGDFFLKSVRDSFRVIYPSTKHSTIQPPGRCIERNLGFGCVFGQGNQRVKSTIKLSNCQTSFRLVFQNSDNLKLELPIKTKR